MTVNGKFPGPTLYAREDDTVIVRVTNRANHNLTIHWFQLSPALTISLSFGVLMD